MKSLLIGLAFAFLAWPAAAQQQAARRPVTIEVHVTDRTGRPIEGARVSADGPSDRSGDTVSTGRVVFRNVTPGTYRFRIERDAFIALEKEVVVRAGVPTIQAALSPAPKTAAVVPAAAPAAPVAPAPAASSRNTAVPSVPAAASRTAAVVPSVPGTARSLSIPDLAEREYISKEPVKESMIGCSGVSDARLIQVKELLPMHTHGDADETIYIVAGNATLRIGDKEQAVTPGWFTMVPRGQPHSVTPKGRNPVIALAIMSGPPCASAGSSRSQ